MKRLLLLAALLLVLAAPGDRAAAYELLHAFTGGDKDGRTPTFQSSLAPSGAVFYGMTQDGGKYTNGVIFQIGVNGSGFKAPA